MTCIQKDETQQSLYEEQWPQKVSGPFLNIQGSESRGLGHESPGDYSEEFRALACYGEPHASLDHP